ncbi:hypothetical protein ACFPAF_19390 [Hymenobacter endophyticus]|uniref:Uncharacterized protein n=1 Tax=Hymenobacter endophyticus TaxID=3076335 RepID=A0ABU3TMI0_9BACT|nr:hypothetical protein [Hymenobacter endophyticus]MDU0372574.1 hypothetical protein [Hymenobacter endophyticus]
MAPVMGAIFCYFQLTNIDLERDFINTYVVKNKRQRYLGFIESPKRRGSFLEMLYHGQDLDKRLFQDLRGSGTHESQSIRNRFENLKNADRCYVISVNGALDGQEMLLNEAVDRALGQEGTLILFGNGAGVYYEGEPPYDRYLSL